MEAMDVQPKRPRSIVFFWVGIVMLALMGVAAFIPMLRCNYCYLTYHEALRCWNVARSDHYPENVQRMYENQVRNYRCGRCASSGKVTLLQRMNEWLHSGGPLSTDRW